mmetsp:Transcript_61149/g.107057  ORF Transcript_61149/g.107057 Transcript_61149/m.107057 type:complete len:211 (-) Transcript_61149:504-1136(-)
MTYSPKRFVPIESLSNTLKDRISPKLNSTGKTLFQTGFSVSSMTGVCPLNLDLPSGLKTWTTAKGSDCPPQSASLKSLPLITFTLRTRSSFDFSSLPMPIAGAAFGFPSLPAFDLSSLPAFDLSIAGAPFNLSSFLLTAFLLLSFSLSSSVLLAAFLLLLPSFLLTAFSVSLSLSLSFSLSFSFFFRGSFIFFFFVCFRSFALSASSASG